MKGIFKAKERRYQLSELIQMVTSDMQKVASTGEKPEVEVSYNKRDMEYSIFGNKGRILKKKIKNVDAEVASAFIGHLMNESGKLYLLLDLSPFDLSP